VRKGNRKYNREYRTGSGCQSDKWLGLSMSMLCILQMYIRPNILNIWKTSVSGNCLVPDIATFTILLMKTCDEVKALHLTTHCSIYKSFLALRSI